MALQPYRNLETRAAVPRTAEVSSPRFFTRWVRNCSVIAPMRKPTNTTLQDEYLLRRDGKLEVCRVYNCTAAKGKQSKIFARANHPTAEGCSDLMGLKLKGPRVTRCPAGARGASMEI